MTFPSEAHKPSVTTLVTLLRILLDKWSMLPFSGCFYFHLFSSCSHNTHSNSLEQSYNVQKNHYAAGNCMLLGRFVDCLSLNP